MSPTGYPSPDNVKKHVQRIHDACYVLPFRMPKPSSTNVLPDSEPQVRDLNRKRGSVQYVESDDVESDDVLPSRKKAKERAYERTTTMSLRSNENPIGPRILDPGLIGKLDSVEQNGLVVSIDE